MIKESSTKIALLVVVGMPFVYSPAAADEYQTIWIDKGQSVDIYWQVNLAGKVYLSADVAGQPACLDYWWIIYPFTQIKKLGRHCGRASFLLPGLSDWGIGGKLRAGNAEGKTRILGTSQETVANSFPVNF
ncbi:hypothetical protein ACFYE9_11510 [Rhizobium leguminosarum]|uniref:Uncharacterized protein n=2 Tax=Rhizobium leguminosarum TaxID=384 RepID=A0A154IEB9_RHILE|nr:hypothetical protein [Rhizobium leguminosarum]KZA98319.1 hypothetical protein A4A59_28050 [Rhizobium leguminosarum]